MKQTKKLKARKNLSIHILKVFFWFTTGAALAVFLFISFTFIIYEKVNSKVVFPGITIGNMDIGKYTEKQVSEFFAKKNEAIENTQFTFSLASAIATISAKDLKFGYDQDLIAKQAISLGRSDDFLSNTSIVFQAYFDGLSLRPAYHYSENMLEKALTPFAEKVNKNPVDALFNFQNGKVLTFRPSEEGQIVDLDKIKKDLRAQFEKIFSKPSSAWSKPSQTRSKPSQTRSKQKPQEIAIPIAIKTLLPKITTDQANDLGIKELIGEGSSLFQHSIPSRIFNITLAAGRINGILIAPNEEFSFAKALGDVSAFTGYQQAYVIQNGKTVLGDGGGVCQVSTTFFRAILNAGVPITERYAHAYRVGYYEQNSPPGLDATVYVPSVDLKFKNDTNNYILVQTQVNQDSQQLFVFLYGTKDGRSVTLTTPVVTNRILPPPDMYRDDSTLSKGTIRQVDFSAEGSKVSFTRNVTKNGKKIISETFVSNYAPWQSIFLRGTKE